MTFPRVQIVGGPVFDSRFNHQESVTIDSLDAMCGEDPDEGISRFGPSVSLGRLGDTTNASNGKFRASFDLVGRLQVFSSGDIDDAPSGGGVYLKAGISNRGFEQEAGLEFKLITGSYLSGSLSAGYAVSEPVFEAGTAKSEHGPVFGLGVSIGF